MNRFKSSCETIITMLERKTKMDRSDLLIWFAPLIITLITLVTFFLCYFSEREPTGEEITKYSTLGDLMWENGIQDMHIKTARIYSNEGGNIVDIYSYPLNSDKCEYINFEITLEDGTVIERAEETLTFKFPYESEFSKQIKILKIDYSSSEKSVTTISNFSVFQYLAVIIVLLVIGVPVYLIFVFLFAALIDLIRVLQKFFSNYKETKAEIVQKYEVQKHETREDESQEDETYENETQENETQENESQENESQEDNAQESDPESYERRLEQLFENHQEIVKRICNDDIKDKSKHD